MGATRVGPLCAGPAVLLALGSALAACPLGTARQHGEEVRPEGALHRAAWDGDAARVEALLSEGAPIDAKEGPEWTPLHYATIAGRAEAARLLLDRGADPNARGRTDMTPLHWAAFKGRAEIAELMIRRGGRVDARNLYGMTPLHEAATEAVVETLLAAGASLTAIDFDGMTPLHIARSGLVAKLMLARGADIRTRSLDGRTGLDVAVVEPLESKGLMFYGPRASARLRADARAPAVLDVTMRNVSERTLTDLEVEVDSDVATGTVSPAKVARLPPAERVSLRFYLRARPGVPEGEHPLWFVVRAGGARLGKFDLRADTTMGTTPEDLGMIKLGKGSLRKKPTRISSVAYLVVPVLVGVIWLVLRKRAETGPRNIGK